MKIICKKNDLVKSTNIVMKAVSNKTTMPILESILIEAYNDNIKMTGNDMEMGIETLVSGVIEREGAVLVEAKMFFEEEKKREEGNRVLRETLIKIKKKSMTIDMSGYETKQRLD